GRRQHGRMTHERKGPGRCGHEGAAARAKRVVPLTAASKRLEDWSGQPGILHGQQAQEGLGGAWRCSLAGDRAQTLQNTTAARNATRRDGRGEAQLGGERAQQVGRHYRAGTVICGSLSRGPREQLRVYEGERQRERERWTRAAC